jgi:hypothetical protein
MVDVLLCFQEPLSLSGTSASEETRITPAEEVDLCTLASAKIHDSLIRSDQDHG